MTAPRPMPLWAGRTTALAGILLVALNLRTAVAAVSPIAAEIGQDIDLDQVGLGVIGALPPVAFAAAGLFGAPLVRRVGLEPLVLISSAVIILGHLLRGVATSYPLLLAGSIVAFAGIGIANILLPPLVRRYFPDRIGLMTTLYAGVMALSTAGSAAVAAPIADSAGWRVSLGIWSALAAVGVLPWLVMLVNHRRAGAAAVGSADVVQHAGSGPVPLRRSRTAWAIAVVFAVSAFNVYACFAWLPLLLIEQAGVTPAEAGALLAVYSLVGLPSAILVPLVVSRMRHPGWLIWLGAAAIVAGSLGLLIAPTGATVLWVILAGLGPLLFPVALVLINTRSRTQQGTIALSAFAQGIGYTGGAVGPILVGVLHEQTGGWFWPVMVFLVTAVAALVAGAALRAPTFVEDEGRRG